MERGSTSSSEAICLFKKGRRVPACEGSESETDDVDHPIRFHRHTRPIGTFNRHNPARGRASTAHRIGGGNKWNAEDCIARTVVFPLSRHPVSRLAFCGLHQLIFTSHLHCASLAPTQSIFLRVKNNGGFDGHLQRSFSSWDRRTGPG